VVVSGGGGGAEIATDKSYVMRRAMEGEEKKETERRMAEVDVDLAEKYGLVEDEAGGSEKGRERDGGDKRSVEEENAEEDAF
jgi:hypothetical protein